MLLEGKTLREFLLRQEAEGGRRVEPRRLVRRGLKEWGWKMELTLHDDRGAITFKIDHMGLGNQEGGVKGGDRTGSSMRGWRGGW